VRFHWLLPSIIGVLGSLLLSSTAHAARLQLWRFNQTENRLVFTTDEGIQPRAQYVPNPNRVVIDLPGVRLDRPSITQTVGGAIREIRLGQYDEQTTRIVIELSAGYSLDPQQVEVRGSTATQWIVQLPTPQPIAQSPATGTPANQSAPPALGAATQLDSVQVTPDGFFIRTTGAAPELEMDRSRNRRELRIDLENTSISPGFAQRDQTINRFGVNRLEITQEETSPPIARITLELSDPASDWQATVSSLGGIVLIPSGIGTSLGDRASSATDSSSPVASTPTRLTQAAAVIQAVDLAASDTQLLIRSQGAIDYTGRWNRSSGEYEITISNAELAEEVRGPELGNNAPLQRVRLREEEDQVIVLIQPARNVRIGELNQPAPQLLALDLQRTGQQVPGRPSQPSLSSDLPRVQQGRVVVVIDPGHGGPDPGAVGIGGLREVDVVLPVSLEVATLLQQQGVEVVLTRSDDRDLDLEPRVQIAERANADLFVSIHANAISLSRPEVNGIETYYYSDRGLRVARVLHSNMLQVPGVQDRGIRQARFYVIRNTSMPAVLLELGFVTGAQDVRLLTDPNFRSQMARAIALGILQYIQQNF